MSRAPNELGRSLYAQHLRILGYPAGAGAAAPDADADADADAAERGRIAHLQPPPLRLPATAATGRRPWLGQQALVAALPIAALLALGLATARFLLPASLHGDTLRSKGDGGTFIYWERDGVVRAWAGTPPLINGDRVRVEVVAGTAERVYLAVSDRSGRLLSAPAWVEDGALTLVTGARGSFPGSVKLVGTDEGETLVIVHCLRGDEEATVDAPLFGGRGGEHPELGTDATLPRGCRAERFPLR